MSEAGEARCAVHILTQQLILEPEAAWKNLPRICDVANCAGRVTLARSKLKEGSFYPYPYDNDGNQTCQETIDGAEADPADEPAQVVRGILDILKIERQNGHNPPWAPDR